jgi:hypothetical protein
VRLSLMAFNPGNLWRRLVLRTDVDLEVVANQLADCG